MSALKRITLCFENCASMQIDATAVKSASLSGVKESVSIDASSGHTVHKTLEVECVK